jgi:hypothetical protein
VSTRLERVTEAWERRLGPPTSTKSKTSRSVDTEAAARAHEEDENVELLGPRIDRLCLVLERLCNALERGLAQDQDNARRAASKAAPSYPEIEAQVAARVEKWERKQARQKPRE